MHCFDIEHSVLGMKLLKLRTLMVSNYMLSILPEFILIKRYNILYIYNIYYCEYRIYIYIYII